MLERTCTRCHESLSPYAFPLREDGRGLNEVCRQCLRSAAQEHEWRRKHRDLENMRRRRGRHTTTPRGLLRSDGKP